MGTILLLTPPFTQLNAPYPAVPCLTRTLTALGYSVRQADIGLETTLRLFSSDGLRRVLHAVPAGSAASPRLSWALAMADRLIDAIDPVVRYLQGLDPTLAHQICHHRLLPESPRLQRLEELDWAFGTLGITDQARHRCTLFLEDLADLVTEFHAPLYRFSRYGETLATGATRFAPIARELARPPGLVESFIGEVVEKTLKQYRPDLIGFSVPFPGTLLGALRAARVIKHHHPEIPIVLGGGFVNTELRELQAPALFDLVDFVTLDDGEEPLVAILEHLAGVRSREDLCRTFVRHRGTVRFLRGPTPDLGTAPKGFPSFEGLPTRRYLAILDLLNPTHRLWSDGRWHKLPLAHGCYWKQCAFCDTTLPHVADFRPTPARELADRMERLVAETGQTGFHFVDEAAPPALLRHLALEILQRGLIVSWWGNVRFERAYTPDLCRLLAASGCIAVTGGLEVASDRLLRLMNKGVTVEQVARAAAAFTGASIMVHAYLMYGFPSQTLQEIVDALERVRQLFDEGLIQSAFWHRFYATAHSPVGRNPAAFGITLTGPPRGDFAWNDLEYRDSTGCDADLFGPALDTALYHYMLGEGLDRDVRTWFDRRVPRPRVSRHAIRRMVTQLGDRDERTETKRHLVWLGGRVVIEADSSSRSRKNHRVHIAGPGGTRTFRQTGPVARWLQAILDQSRPRGRGTRAYLTLEEASRRFPGGEKGLTAFADGPCWRWLREEGLLLV